MKQLVPLTPWVDTILGRLNGAVPDMVRTEVNNAVREFFVESTVWRVDMLLSVQESTPTIDLTGRISGGDVTFVLRAYFKERLLEPVAEFPFGWDSEGDPQNYWSPEPSVIRLSPIPTKDEKHVLRLQVAVKPNSCQVPSWTETHFFKAITDGALARIYRHPKKPYTSPSLSEAHGNSFRSGIARAKSMASRRFTSAEHPFRFPGGWSPVV